MLRCAFTLIELLVVMAIIAILAAILFPVFAQARETPRQVAPPSSSSGTRTKTRAAPTPRPDIPGRCGQRFPSNRTPHTLTTPLDTPTASLGCGMTADQRCANRPA